MHEAADDFPINVFWFLAAHFLKFLSLALEAPRGYFKPGLASPFYSSALANLMRSILSCK
jgi:hypothetical protein